ncbi:MAG: bifunctional diaminohydroxyphosphoribosylaminopyrimidine deaminase/5-amino-6-(5-phosphoribosylamino)uracil reductase RibD, partial [Candidatus Dormibacteria bacterium]
MTASGPADGDDVRWMRRALELAGQADYRTSPNPMVGAVVLDRWGALAGEGFHRRPGLPHAEAEALAAAGERAKGGTLVVNLEPCSHHARTPPCADAVVRAGVRRVVAAMVDPNPEVDGAGLERIMEAGIEVAVGACEGEARRLNSFFIHHARTRRPFVSAKFAASLDGKIATASGQSRWISGPESRRYTHRLRHIHDAIMVGVNTVLADDPRLTARDLPEGDPAAAPPGPRQPLRVVLDSALRIARESRVLMPEEAGSRPRTLLATTARADAARVEALRESGIE